MAEPADSSEEPIEIDGELVAEVRPLPLPAAGGAALARRPVTVPATVAAATGGFVLGVATFVLVRVLRRPAAARRLARRRRRMIGGRRGAEIASTRSFLIDVHQLKR